MPRVFGIGLALLLTLGACSSSQYRSARDNTLVFFGMKSRPAVARTGEPPKAEPASTPVPEDEPVPVAAPRAPVETEGVTPPPGKRAGGRS